MAIEENEQVTYYATIDLRLKYLKENGVIPGLISKAGSGTGQ